MLIIFKTVFKREIAIISVRDKTEINQTNCKNGEVMNMHLHIL